MEIIEVKEFLEVMKSEIKAELRAQNTIIDKIIIPKLDQSIAHGEKTNGRVSSLEDVIKPINFVMKHKLVSFILFASFWFILDWASSNINIKKTVTNKTGIEFSTIPTLNDSLQIQQKFYQ